MPKVKKEEVKKESTPIRVRKTKKTEESSKSEFSFGAMSREERRAVIEESIGNPKKEVPDLSWKVEETEYVPNEWVVVITPDGIIYQEPVPRYMDAQYFVYVLASIPSSPIVGNRIDFDADIFKTSFSVKGVDCIISTVSYNGERKENPYSKAFTINNGTSKIGGNLVFSKDGKGFNKKEIKSVVADIIKKLNSYEEIVECK